MYDLKNYKLTLPVNSEGKLEGSAHEVLTDLENFKSEWFEYSVAHARFICPDGGATTDNAKYARSELRDMREYSYKEKFSDTLMFSVQKLEMGHKVVVHQAHDKEVPWFKLAFDRDSRTGICRLRVAVKMKESSDEDTWFALMDDLSLGDFITSEMRYTPPGWMGLKKPHLKFIIKSGGEKKVLNVKPEKTGKYGKVYMKRGAYYQNKEKKGKTCCVWHH